MKATEFRHLCRYCGKRFETNADRHDHERDEHERRALRCPVCGGILDPQHPNHSRYP